MAWRLCKDLLPSAPQQRGCGMLQTPLRQIVTTVLYIFITGWRWCEVPRGPPGASKSATPRWWQRWQADGTLSEVVREALCLLEERDELLALRKEAIRMPIDAG